MFAHLEITWVIVMFATLSRQTFVSFDLHRTLWCFGSITLSKLTFSFILVLYYLIVIVLATPLG